VAPEDHVTVEPDVQSHAVAVEAVDLGMSRGEVKTPLGVLRVRVGGRAEVPHIERVAEKCVADGVREVIFLRALAPAFWD
jgi:hypothetical protein